MDLIPPSEQLCYVRCSFCNTVLAVGIPCKRSLDTVTVKCGHCSSLSFLSTKALPIPPQCLDHHPMSAFQGFSHDHRRAHSSSTSSSSLISSLTTSVQPPTTPKESHPHHVVKPPERKHRLPSAYNRFMKEEIQRIKSANPDIPHREAFSAAAKNWARYPHSQSADPGASKNEKQDTSAVGIKP